MPGGGMILAISGGKDQLVETDFLSVEQCFVLHPTRRFAATSPSRGGEEVVLPMEPDLDHVDANGRDV